MSEGLDVDRAKALIEQACERAAVDAAEHLLAASNRKVPLRTRELQKSGRVSSDGTEAAVSYGTDHAVIEHEDMTAKHTGDRQAKFLESSMSETAGAIAQMIADRIREEAGL